MRSRLSIFTTIISLLILATIGFVIFNIFSFSSRLKEKVEIVVYLKDSADTIAIKKEIAEMKEVKRVSFISRRETLNAFKKKLGKDQDIFSVLQINPLPDSFLVILKSQFVTLDSVQKMCAKLEELKGVEEVRCEEELLNRLPRLLKILEIGGLIGSGIITVYVILVLFIIGRLEGRRLGRFI